VESVTDTGGEPPADCVNNEASDLSFGGTWRSDLKAGLVAALKWPARSTREQTGIRAHAVCDVTGEIPRQAAVL
jgi:hypothetical protein